MKKHELGKENDVWINNFFPQKWIPMKENSLTIPSFLWLFLKVDHFPDFAGLL